MFNRISQSYDLMNRVMTGGLDVLWRKRLVSLLPKTSGLRVLDLATGTGDLALLMAKMRPDLKEILALDRAVNMLDIAKKKAGCQEPDKRLAFIEGDVESIPFGDNTMDVLSISFGIRNVESLDKGLSEIYRVLKPGGCFLVLESSLPQNKILRWGHFLYSRYIMPNLAALITRDKSAYLYLNQSMESFPYGDAFLAELSTQGFKKLQCFPQLGGAVSIYQGEK